MNKKMAIAFISIGLALLVIGLIMGLRNIKPVQMNVISGIVIVIGTCFGLFGKQLQDLSSSEKSDRILKTGQNTSEKVDSLNNKLEAQAQTIDKLRVENTDLYTKLSLSQRDILYNTERNLQPLSIDNLAISLSYNFDNPNVEKIKNELLTLKNEIETELSKYPPAVDGQRSIPSIPGVIYFPDADNKINTTLIIQNETIISKLNFVCPNIVFQLLDKYPTETREKLSDGTSLVKPDVPISLELTSYQENSNSKVQSISFDLVNQKMIFLINIQKWHYTKDNGQISSFKDLFGKYLKVKSYYSNYLQNQNKIVIVSAVIINDKKRLQFTFDDSDKSKSVIEFNASYVHLISENNFAK